MCTDCGVSSHGDFTPLSNFSSCHESVSDLKKKDEKKKRIILWRCFRCPVSYDLKHRPKDVHVITDGLFLCIRHIQEDEELPELRQVFPILMLLYVL